MWDHIENILETLSEGTVPSLQFPHRVFVGAFCWYAYYRRDFPFFFSNFPHEKKKEKNRSMFLCSFKALDRGLYGNLAHDTRLCLMWALMSCKDHTQGLYPTTQMVRAEWGPRGSLMTTPIERATLEWRTYKLELCFLTWIYIYISLCTSHTRISTTSSLKMFRVCLFWWMRATNTNTPTNKSKCDSTLPLGFHHPNIRAWRWK